MNSDPLTFYFSSYSSSKKTVSKKRALRYAILCTMYDI